MVLAALLLFLSSAGVAVAHSHETLLSEASLHDFGRVAGNRNLRSHSPATPLAHTPSGALNQVAKAPVESARDGATEQHQRQVLASVVVQEAIVAPDGCVIKEDVRAQAWFTKAAEVGSKCLFRVDSRDEGTHCIPELKYGSNGWCYTKADKSEWGSCGDACSLYGPPSVLSSIIDVVNQNIDDLIPQVDAAVAANTASTNKAALEVSKMSVAVAAKEAREAEYAKKMAAATAAQAMLDLTRNDAQGAATAPHDVAKEAEKSLMLMQLKTAYSPPLGAFTSQATMKTLAENNVVMEEL